MNKKEKAAFLSNLTTGKASLEELQEKTFLHLVGFELLHPYYINEKPVSEETFSEAFERDLKNRKNNTTSTSAKVVSYSEASKRSFVIKKTDFNN